ncbi:MAG: protein kinase, partial [Pirellulaceae bacterium]|nr:protein kinase [Pirellulaceae bacterium]
MPVSLAEFAERLSRFLLMTPEEVDAFRQSLDRPLDSPSQLANALVRGNRLTEYQARKVYQDKESELVVGDYNIIDLIGSGGMGKVYRALHRPMNREVALKVLPHDSFDSRDAVLRFQREVRAAAKLNHPNIVAAHDAGEFNGLHYLVMQYVEGTDFTTLVAEGGPITVAKAVDYVRQAAEGLRHAHDQGIVHRDIKPSNILVDSGDVVKLLDLGLARFTSDGDSVSEESGRLTLPGQMLGTAEYVSPEQAEDTHEADARSDIYSLGCTLHFLLTGRTPYEGESMVALVLAHHNDPIPSLRDLRDDVPGPLDTVFMQMLAKDPDGRPQTAADVIAALNAVGEVPNSAPPEVAPAAKQKDRTIVSGDSNTLAFTENQAAAVKTKDSSDGGIPGDGDDLRVDDDLADDLSADDEESSSGTVVRQDTQQRAPVDSLGPDSDALTRRVKRTPPIAASDNEAALWVLEIGGSVIVALGDEHRRVRGLDEMPAEQIVLEGIVLDYNRFVADEDLTRFRNLPCLRRIYLHGVSITNQGLKHLRVIRSLEQISVGQSAITDTGLAYLLPLTNLKQLSLSDTAVTDSGL